MIDALTAWLPENLLWWLLLGWAVYFIVLACWIVLQRREPMATLSWLLALAALPYIGFLLYYLLGPERIRRYRSRRLRSRAEVARAQAPVPAAPADGPLLALLAHTTGFPPTTCTSVQLLVDGGRTYDHLLQAIAAARDHIHLEYYIFEPDRTGAMIRDALAARARAGVKVRLLVDAVGAYRLGDRFLAPLLEAGGEVARFHPIKLRRIRRPRLNLRTHRKIVVVDGTTAFTGGINICDENNERRSATAYHDLHLRLAGEVVHWLQLTFLEDWHYATGAVLREPALWPQAERGTVPALVVPSGPDSELEPIHRTFVEMINAARSRVWLVTPYFAPGEAGMMALTSAAMKGLDVRLLIPRRSDSLVATAVAHSWFDQLLAAGVRVFEYHQRMVHTKALLVDDDRALVGSANFDHRSFYLNFEIGVLFLDPGIAAELEALIEGDCGDGCEVKPGRERPPFHHRLWMGFARLLSPMV